VNKLGNIQQQIALHPKAFFFFFFLFFLCFSFFSFSFSFSFFLHLHGERGSFLPVSLYDHLA
jgi:hypothetical protein